MRVGEKDERTVGEWRGVRVVAEEEDEGTEGATLDAVAADGTNASEVLQCCGCTPTARILTESGKCGRCRGALVASRWRAVVAAARTIALDVRVV